MFTNVDAQNLVLQLYGYHGIAGRLPGEEDFNFHFTTTEGQNFLLKISHVGASLAIIDLQNTILHRLASMKLPFQTPVLQATINGEWIHQLSLPDGQSTIVRLLSFVPGTLLAQARPHTSDLLASLGSQVGHLSQALYQANHPAAQRVIKWDLQQAGWISEHVLQLDTPQDQQTILYFLHQFEHDIAPILPKLRQSIIHGDINDYNILVSNQGQVSGFIDFGDLLKTSTICELAITLAYAIMDHPDPLAAASIIIKAYHGVFPLQEPEIDILFGLIGTRLCTSVINSALRKKAELNNSYLYISERPAWDLLRMLQKIDGQYARRTFRNACGLEYATYN
jgi:Ser/Thr protein kinase RdoA (MazF antagonist)